MFATEGDGVTRIEVGAVVEFGVARAGAVGPYAPDAVSPLGVGVENLAKCDGRALSFTLETDGNLPDGSALAAAIQTVDDSTDAYPAYYMINCAPRGHRHRLRRTGRRDAGGRRGSSR